jgi:16S rRNA (cytosine1402-N4)-methyltransferase
MDSDASSGQRHASVLLKEVVDAFRAAPAGVIVDATVGAGGHSEALLATFEASTLIGIDRDSRALAIAAERLKQFGSRVQLVIGRHEELIEILERIKVNELAGVLADLGVSSMQFDEAERGFSFRFDAPLDMRMAAEGETAAELLAHVDEAELMRILREYGEEPMARRIARAIIEEREIEPITTTARLAGIIRKVKRTPRERIDPATLTFQALRIAVNRELVELEKFLRDAVDRLVSGGVIAVISFHSLEDRIVKQTFRSLEGRCVCPPRMPVCRCGAVKKLEVLTRHPIEAGEEEVARNPRSRSAKLRVAVRV